MTRFLSMLATCSCPAWRTEPAPVGAVADALRMDDLNLNRRSFASATIEANIRPLLAHGDAPLTQRATGALLSDTWSPRDESEFGRRVDRIVANELIEDLELPGRILSMQAPDQRRPAVRRRSVRLGPATATSFERPAFRIRRRTGG